MVRASRVTVALYAAQRAAVDSAAGRDGLATGAWLGRTGVAVARPELTPLPAWSRQLVQELVDARRQLQRCPRSPSPAAQAKLQQAFHAHDALTSLMAAGRERFQPATRPVLPAPSPTDLAPLKAAVWAERKRQASIWRRGQRKRLRLEAAAAARVRAEQRDRELAEQHRWLQVEADVWWERLRRGEERTLTAALKQAFADNPAPVDIVRAEENEAALVLRLPGTGVLPERKAHVTPGGKATTKAWTKTDLADVYADLLGAHLLATLRESWAVGPSLRDVRVIGVRGQGSSAEVLFDVEASRDVASRGDGYGRVLLDKAVVGLRRSGRTREVAPWPASELEPEVAALARCPDDAVPRASSPGAQTSSATGGRSGCSQSVPNADVWRSALPHHSASWRAARE